MKKLFGLCLIFGTIALQFSDISFVGSGFPQSPAELGFRLVTLATLGIGVSLVRTKKRIF
jgi:hypothetical protein